MQSSFFNFEWMRAELDAKGVGGFLAEYDAVNIPEAQLLQQALRLSGRALADSNDELAAQLLARLLDQESPKILGMLEQAKRWSQEPWLQPLTRSLTAPGGPLLSTLIFSHSTLTCVAVTPDGRQVISGSYGNTLSMFGTLLEARTPQTGGPHRNNPKHRGGAQWSLGCVGLGREPNLEGVGSDFGESTANAKGPLF